MADDVVGKLIFKVITDAEEAKKGLSDFQDGMKDTQDEAKKTEQKVTDSEKKISAGAVAIAVAVGAAVVKLGKEVLKATSDIQNGEKIIANATGAGGKALEGLMDSAKKVFAQNDATFDEVSSAIGEVNTRLGLTDVALEQTTGLFLDFADATGTDVKNSVASVTQIMQRWGVETEKLPSLLDKLTLAGQQSGISIDALEQSLVTNAGTLQAMGYTMDEAISMMMSFELAGIDSTQVIMGMKKSFEDSAKAGTDARQDWETLLDSITNSTSQAEANSIAVETFGNRIATDMVTALQSGSLAFDQFTDSITHADGTLSATEENAKTTADRIQEFKNAVTVAFAELGIAISPIVDKLLPSLTTEITKVIGFVTTIVTKFTGAKTSTDDLAGAVSTLTTHTDAYRTATENLLKPVDDMTEAEKRLYEIEQKRAKIAVEEDLKTVGDAYISATKEIDGYSSMIERLNGKMDALAIAMDDEANGTQNLYEAKVALILKQKEGIELSEREMATLQTLNDISITRSVQSVKYNENLQNSYEETYSTLLEYTSKLEVANVGLDDSVVKLAIAFNDGYLDLDKYALLYPELIEKVKECASSMQEETAVQEENNTTTERASGVKHVLYTKEKELTEATEERIEVEKEDDELAKTRQKNADAWIEKLRQQTIETQKSVATELESMGDIRSAYAVREQIIRDEWAREKKILEEKVAKNEATEEDIGNLNLYYNNQITQNNKAKNDAIYKQEKKLADEEKKLAEDASKKQIDEAEKAKQKIKDTISSTISMVMSLANQLTNIYSSMADNYKAQLKNIEKARNEDLEKYQKDADERVEILEEQHEKGLISDEDYRNKKKQIEKDLAKATKERTAQDEAEEKKLRQKVNEMDKKAFEAKKKTAIAQAIIDGASAIMKGFAELGPVAGAVYAGIQAGVTTAQTIVIANQEYVPSYAIGSKYIPKNQYALLHEGEMVLTRREANKMREIGGVENLERMVSSSVGTESIGLEPVRIDNNLSAVIEVDGTQLGIAVLKNIDSASQFVLR